MTLWLMVRHQDGRITGNNCTGDWGHRRPKSLWLVRRITPPWTDWTHEVYIETDTDDYDAAIDIARQAFDAMEDATS